MAINDPEFGLVLGGGGARGLVHIHVLEVLDELGLRPKIIAGTSIGALYGAAYAAGICGEEIRAFSLDALGKRIRILKRLFGYRPNTLFQLWNKGNFSHSLLRPETLLENLYPEEVHRNIEELDIELKIIAADYYNQSTVVLNKGPVIPAVAASIALPVIFRPVTIDGVVLVDGGLVNPAPFDTIQNDIKQIVAIDVTGAPVKGDGASVPSGVDILMGSAQIMQNVILNEKAQKQPPTILYRAPVQHIPALGFHKIRDILDETAGMRDELKWEIEQKLEKSVIAMGYREL